MDYSPFTQFLLAMLNGIFVIFSLTATALAWVAVVQIVRSKGRLHGLWLALLVGILIPLLAIGIGMARVFRQRVAIPPVASGLTTTRPAVLNAVVIDIAGNGPLLVAGEPCPLERLSVKLGELGAKSSTRVLVRGDRSASAARIQAVMIACGNAGIMDISFEVNPSPQKAAEELAPASAKAPKALPLKSVTIEIIQGGLLRVAGEPCLANQLQERLKALAADASTRVFLIGDSSISYDQIMAPLNICSNAGFANIALEPNAAVSDAKEWLAEIDAGHYEQSWRGADAFFQNAITEARWSSALGNVRKPLGDLLSRKLKSLQEASSLPGAPDGLYVVMQFDTSFAGKQTAVETVTFTKQADGTWRASGYIIKYP